MDLLTTALAAAIGVVAVSIVAVVLMLVRRRGVPDLGSWESDPAPLPAELAPFWHRESGRAVRPLAPPDKVIALDDLTAVALTAWQDSDGSLVDAWLEQQDRRLARLGAAEDRSDALRAVLSETSSSGERSVREAVDRCPDRELRSHLAEMQRSGIDSLVSAARADLAGAAASYTTYLSSRTLAEARVDVLDRSCEERRG